MKEIYNEGRVVGLNTWELYLRQLLSTNPEATPMTEREWLASTISESASMILKIASGTTKGYHDYILPRGCELCGCTMIHGFMFEGEVTLDSTGYWAAKVSSYGNLISNTSTSHPVTPGTSAYVPTAANPEVITDEIKERAKNFLKLSSGLMIQPGQWTSGIVYSPLVNQIGQPILTQSGQQLLAPVGDSVLVPEENTRSSGNTRGGAKGGSENTRAANDEGTTNQILEPDLSELGFIRIAVSETLTSDVYIFLHGFVQKSAIRGNGSNMTSGISSRPQDGDFLGPVIFPWACPIMLIVTTNIIEITNNGVVIKLVN